MIQYGIAFEYTPFEDIPVELQPYVEEYGEEYELLFSFVERSRLIPARQKRQPASNKAMHG